MARYKEYSYDQTKLIPISYDQQIIPGTFEHTLSEVINSMDMGIFEKRYGNDETGAPAYDPRILLKIVLYAYSKGIIFSRRIAQCCCENVIFMALSADSQPHFTTIADFVSTMQEEIVSLFRHVLQICMELELIDGSMFAIDGVKLPSNASKEWSGTKADLQKKREKLEAALRYMVDQHRKRDKVEEDKDEDGKKFSRRLDRARKKIEKLDRWLCGNNDRPGSRGRIVQSNVTDNESVKMKTSHGVLQGYNGIAVVDSKYQVVVNAEAFSEGQDYNLLKPALEGTKETFEVIGIGDDILQGAVVTADTGFHTTENLAYLEGEKIDGYIPDCNFRKRDPRFASAARHKEKPDLSLWGKKRYERADFIYVKRGDYFLCPAGNRLNHQTSDLVYGTVTYRKYACKVRLCNTCAMRSRCLTQRHHKARSVFLRSDGGGKYCDRMAAKIDTLRGRTIYSKRMSIVEPVFGNLRWAKGLSRFTLRRKKKVNVQWLLYCMVHNIEKICNFGQPALA
jgi:Transposase and inactivated derivatives